MRQTRCLRLEEMVMAENKPLEDLTLKELRKECRKHRACLDCPFHDEGMELCEVDIYWNEADE